MLKNTYSVSILCGGKSTRMGYDKAMLDWNGIPLLKHIADSFRTCDDVFLSVRSENQYADFPIRKTCDQFTGCGPLAGLYASLQSAAHDILFVTTCDAPLADIETADLLNGALGTHDCVVPVSDDLRPHPLMAVYRRSVSAHALKNLEQGILRISSLLEDIDTVYFPAEKLPKGELTLSNLNTPEDTARLMQAIRL